MSCGRFEAEALLAFERGDALDPHFDTCPDCAGAKGKYEWLRRELAAVDEGIEEPAGLEARVWARIALQAPAERASLGTGARAWIARMAPARLLRSGLAGALAVGLAAFFLWPRPAAVPLAPSLAMDIVNGAVVVRGRSAQPGNVLRLLATTGTSKYAEVRVYRAENLVLHCSSEPPCRREGDRIEVDAPIKAPGRHELILLLSDAPLPKPQSGFDADMEAAAKAGAQIIAAAPVEAF